MLDGRRSVFGPEALGPDLLARCAAFDIHPTGPLWGRGALRTASACLELETRVLVTEVASPMRAGLERAGLEQERRMLRLRPEGLAWDWTGEDVLRLDFALPAGAYATAVLAELGDLESGGAYRPS
jgi:tRNA pseudouridine13 synthase